MLNPWLLLAIVLAWGTTVAGAGWRGYEAGKDHCIAEQIRDTAVAEIAAESAAKAIAKIEVKNTTIRQTLEKEIHEKPVFRDCRSGPDAVRVLNSTQGIAQSASSPG